MRLKAGDVLAKKRGGATRRMEVLRVSRDGQVTLKALAASTQARARRSVPTVVLPLGDGGLPEGYRRAEVTP
jgi:hypothetical protein